VNSAGKLGWRPIQAQHFLFKVMRIEGEMKATEDHRIRLDIDKPTSSRHVGSNADPIAYCRK
jgi:hypothetical protein